MSDLFDQIIKQALEPDADVRPVLQPIFPLAIPERETRMVLITPTFSAEVDAEPSASASITGRDELTLSPRLAPSHPQAEKANDTPQPAPTSAPISTAIRTVSPPANQASEEASAMPDRSTPQVLPAIIPSPRVTSPVLREQSHAQPEATIQPTVMKEMMVRPTVQPIEDRAEEIVPKPATIKARPVQLRPIDSALSVVPNLAAEEQASPPLAPTSSMSAPQEIRITIGRIEVRTVDSPTVSARQSAKPHVPRLALADYLRSRGGSS